MKRLPRIALKISLLCSGGFMSTGCAVERNSAPNVPADWRRLDAGSFSIYAPPNWEFHKLQGIDSDIGELVGDRIRLVSDFGSWSNPLDEARSPDYVIVHQSIGGYHAKIVSPRVSGKGITGIYFRRTSDRNKLCLYGQDLTAPQQELTLRIFRTIRFGSP